MQIDNDFMCLTYLCENYMANHNFVKNLGQETKIGYWPIIVHVILVEGGLFQ